MEGWMRWSNWSRLVNGAPVERDLCCMYQALRVVVGLFKTCLDPRGLRVWQRRSISSDCYLSAGPSVPQTRGGSGCDREIDCRGMGYGAACGRHGDGVGSQVGLVERPDTEDRCG